MTSARRRTRDILVAGYLAVVGFGLVSDSQPRVFWTVLLPLLPVGIVLMGFHGWRSVCPLAFFGEVGRRLNRGPQRRVPPRLELWFFPATLALLLVALVLRLVATNGDRLWLSGLLVALALAAFGTNAIYTGKTWCNFFCPVGFVERVYTEPRSLLSKANSQCDPCTACKRHCPDIDQENAYWKDVMSGGRRLAIYAFPGLVLGFYTYYWLRYGDWEAYFDGRWTRHPVDAALVVGEGFFFAPRVPAVLAATLTLVAFSVASYGLFRLLEKAIRRWVGTDERSRHLGLALAAFTAFNLFYVFAGAPSLRRLPGGTRAAAFVAPLVGTLFLLKRWQRTPEHFVGERGAVRLLRSWPYEEPPPSDPSEVYGWIRASRHARDKDLAAYGAMVRDMIADGLVRPGELRLLEGARKQLGISEREHELILARLSAEERHLFEEGAARGVEAHAQLEGYQVALAEAMLRPAREEEIDELRRSFAVSPDDHQKVLAQVRGASGELLSRARRQLERSRELSRDLAVLGATEPTAPRLFLCYLLARARDESLDRFLELLEVAGDGAVIQSLRRRLFASDPAQREPALRVLALACPGADELVRELEAQVAGRSKDAAEPDRDGEVPTLAGLLEEANPFLRAGAVWAAARHPDKVLEAPLARAFEDEHPLVRETATRFVGVSPDASGERPVGLASIETMHFLHAAPFFADLDPADLYDLSQFAVEEMVAPPATICEAGDAASDALFVVVSGEAEVLGRTPGDPGRPERPIARLGRGELVGELSVLDGSPRSTTVRPEGGPVRVLRIPGPRLRGTLLHRPRAAQALLGVLAGRMRRLVQQAPGP
ncbi:MAG TPA: cyclic nucleotide-binding domain-containing protein [Vicinamibacteria bacterium]|nr:cyclic nucleotide-binding domain-containing protein [Vicinamibacteria bacterium]